MIDVKELRIGAHVSYKGERVKISTLGYAQFTYNNQRDVGLSVNIDPIPITPELLEELGFEKVEEHGAVSIWQHPANVTIAIYGERISLTIGYKLAINSIRYLHELEAFVYMTTKKELIKD